MGVDLDTGVVWDMEVDSDMEVVWDMAKVRN